MTSFAKTTVLSLSLLAGAAFTAHAQSNDVAALPPGAAVAPPAVTAPVGPSVAIPGPNPGGLWSTSEKQTQPVQPSAALPGPGAGGLWSAQEKQTQEVTKSPDLMGPRPN